MRGSRGRLAVALIAVVSGATVISALLNLEFDIERKLTQEFRLLGANLVISRGTGAETGNASPAAPGARGTPTLMDQSAVLGAVDRLRTPDVVAAAPLSVYRRAGGRHADRCRGNVARPSAEA